MDSRLAFWRFIRENIDKKVPVMLLYVVESRGSSPGRQGFSMAVNAVGDMTGSVGGGIMEYKFVEMAKEKLAVELTSLSLHKQVHNKEAAKNQSGMICSGEQIILLYIIQAADAFYIDTIINALAQHATCYLSFSPAGMAVSTQPLPKRYSFNITSSTEWLYEEQVGYKDHLHIIGAGHCGLALSKLMMAMDFYIHLYDERDDLNTFMENQCVHEKKLVEGYNQITNYIPEGMNSYVVVMTSGYRTDDIVMRALLHKKYRYLGVLGSAKKIEKMFAAYRADGVDPVVLHRVNAPAGLPIKSRTPEEIAVSIAAKIIAVRNG